MHPACTEPDPSPAGATVQGMTEPTITLNFPEQDGTVRQFEVTAAQALDANAGRPIAFTPRNERILVDDDGTITYREDARPQRKA